MDTEVLVEPDIDGGRRVVEALDKEGFPVLAAFWNYLPEEGAWRFFIASPKVSEIGPKATYEAIQRVLLEKRIHLPLHRISAVEPDDPLAMELQIFAGTEAAPFIGTTQLQKVVIGDLYVEGAYVYRAQRIIGKSGTFDLFLMTPDKARKIWTARQGKVTVKDGFFKKIDVEGEGWLQSHARAGVNSYLYVPINIKEQNGQTFGDVQRWTILGGRLRSVEVAARNVQIEGLPAASSSSSTGV